MGYNPRKEYNLLELLQKADAGDHEAMSTAVAYISAEGYLDDPDIYEKYLSYLNSLAKSGDAASLIMLGDAYTHGEHIPIDVEKGIRYYREAAGKGIRFGYECIGMLYYEGEVIQQNFKTAFEYFTKADGKKSFCTLYALGIMYWNGLYVEQNPAKACEYFDQIVYDEDDYAAMDDYYWRACYRLAHALHIGEGVEKDLELARDMIAVAKDNAKERSESARKADITYEEIFQEWAEICRELESEE